MKKKYWLWLIILATAIFASYIFLWTSGRRVEEKPYEGETMLTTTSSFDEFSKEVVDLIKRYDGNRIDSEAVSMPFYSRRLIVQGKGDALDLSSYGAKEVIQGTDYLYVMQFTTQEMAKQACEVLSNMEAVEYCEPDQYAEATEYEENIEHMSWGVSRIGADAYAERVKAMTDAEITVAVVDSGVYKHPFLKDRIVEGGRDFIDDDMKPDDEHSHGTHVAGTIVDCTPGLNVKILPIRVLGANGWGSNLVISMGVRYAVEHGAEIINMSLRGAKNQVMDNAVRYAVHRGCTVVVAAGNDSSNTENVSPAHVEECITVAAINDQLEKADFSNWGESVDFAAPGVDILSCVPKFFLGIPYGDAKGIMSGTSMAAPHISALAAMIKLENPSVTSEGIQNIMIEHSIDLGEAGRDFDYGWGMPDFSKEEEKQETDFLTWYKEVLEEYKLLAENRFDYSMREQTQYANEGVWNFSGLEQYEVYYRLADLANDGFPELLISVNEKNAPKNIVDIFGIQDGIPTAVIESNASVGYRSRYYITTDNRIKNVGSGGALNSGVNYYTLPMDSVFPNLTEQYVYDGWDGDKYTYINEEGVYENISPEQYETVSSEADVDIASEWTLLYEIGAGIQIEVEMEDEEKQENIESTMSAYQGIFMKGDIFISTPLYPLDQSETGAVGIVYRASRPTWGEYGVDSDILETIGEIYAGESGSSYQIIGGGGSCQLFYTEEGVKIQGSSEYDGSYIQISNSGANMDPSEVWLDIPGQSVNETVDITQVTNAGGSESEYILPNSDSVEITAEQLSQLTAEQLMLARNEIYARHGRQFDTPEIQQYFDSKSWYVPQYTPDEFEVIQEGIFNEIERKNIELIIQAEN